MADDQNIEYPIKDVLHNMETSLSAQVAAARAESQAQHSETKQMVSEVSQKLDGKADSSWVRGIEEQVKKNTDTIIKHGLDLAGISAVSTFQRWAIGGVGAAVIGALVYILFHR